MIKSMPRAWKLKGKLKAQKPSNIERGTLVEVSSLFERTPARLKFFKNKQNRNFTL